jgi:glycosyltransferase involved in cell wall biosynthesis
LDALGRLERRQPGRFAFVVVGDGPVRTALEAQTARLGLGGQVRFPGYVDHGRLPDLISNATLGLLPFRACEHIQSTLANKLFEYMALGLPVIASDAPPMERVLRETGAGLCFRSDDPADLARVIEELAADEAARKQKAEAGRRAAAQKYHWEIDACRLLDVLKAGGIAP